MMGQKYSYDRGTYMDVGFWLVFDAWGAVRLTRGEPDLKASERGMSVTAKIPHSLFNRPSMKATLNVAAQEAPAMSIDLDVAQNALKEALGVEVAVEIRKPE